METILVGNKFCTGLVRQAMVFLFACLLFNRTCLSQDGMRDEKYNLRLTTEIVQQQYCRSTIYSDMAQMTITLRLTYTNAGRQPLIYYKGVSLPYYILISLNEQNARNKQYEREMHVGWITSGVPKLKEGDKPGKEFLILTPGSTYEAEADITIPVALESNSQYLKAGKYVVQVVMDAWPSSRAQFERLKSKWAKIGLLCGTARSEPMPFEVESSPKLVVCD